MNILSVVGLGIVAAALSAVLKRFSGEFGLFVSLAASLLILCAVVSSLSPLTSLIDELTALSGAGEGQIAIMMKALAVCYVTGLAADCCRDSGEGAIASKIELAGRIAVLMVGVPLIESIMGIVKELIV